MSLQCIYHDPNDDAVRLVRACTSQTSTRITCSVTPEEYSGFLTWSMPYRMRFQRYQSGRWQTINTQYGTMSRHGVEYSRTLTLAKTGLPMRVEIRYEKQRNGATVYALRTTRQFVH